MTGSGRRYSDADRAEARRLRASGWSYARLRAKYGVSKGTLAYWLNAESRERSLQRGAQTRATGHSGSDRFAPEAVAERRYLDALRRDPCAYCGGPGGAIDHIDSTARGGEDDPANLTGACRECNSRKGAAKLLRSLMTPVPLRRIAA